MLGSDGMTIGSALLAVVVIVGPVRAVLAESHFLKARNVFLARIDIATGQEIWRSKVEACVVGPPLLHDDWVEVRMCCGGSPRVKAFDAVSGEGVDFSDGSRAFSSSPTRLGLRIACLDGFASTSGSADGSMLLGPSDAGPSEGRQVALLERRDGSWSLSQVALEGRLLNGTRSGDRLVYVARGSAGFQVVVQSLRTPASARVLWTKGQPRGDRWELPLVTADSDLAYVELGGLITEIEIDSGRILREMRIERPEQYEHAAVYDVAMEISGAGIDVGAGHLIVNRRGVLWAIDLSAEEVVWSRVASVDGVASYPTADEDVVYSLVHVE